MTIGIEGYVRCGFKVSLGRTRWFDGTFLPVQCSEAEDESGVGTIPEGLYGTPIPQGGDQPA